MKIQIIQKIKVGTFLIILLILTSCLHVGAFKEKVIIKYNYKTSCLKILKDNKKHKIYLNKKDLINNYFYYSINGDDVFIISLSKNIIKISLKDNEIKWIKSIASIPQNNFAFDEKYLYFNSIDNNFYMLNYKTGDIENIFFNTNINTILNIKKPYINNNYIIAFFANNELFIIDKTTKKILSIEEYIENVKIENNILNIDGKIINIDLLKK